MWPIGKRRLPLIEPRDEWDAAWTIVTTTEGGFTRANLGVFRGQIAKSSGAFLFVWTLHALGVTAMFSLILSARGLWSLQPRQLR